MIPSTRCIALMAAFVLAPGAMAQDLRVSGKLVSGADSGHLEIYDSRVEGIDSRAISTVSKVTPPTVVHSRVIGTVLAGGCAAITDGSYTFHASSCP